MEPEELQRNYFKEEMLLQEKVKAKADKMLDNMLFKMIKKQFKTE